MSREAQTEYGFVLRRVGDFTSRLRNKLHGDGGEIPKGTTALQVSEEELVSLRLRVIELAPQFEIKQLLTLQLMLGQLDRVLTAGTNARFRAKYGGE